MEAAAAAEATGKPEAPRGRMPANVGGAEMTTRTAVLLARILDTYYVDTSGYSKRFRELASLFDGLGDLPHLTGGAELSVAKHLLSNLEYGDVRAFLDTMLEDVTISNSAFIANTRYEEREFHRGLSSKIQEIKDSLGQPTTPRELTVQDGSKFTAKSERRDFLSQAKSDLFVVDM